MGETNKTPRRPVLLIILDGFGANPSKVGNAVIEANTPHLDHYFAHNPHTLLQASGAAVGLPNGQMGNSEVGHMTLGSGSVVRQDLVVINDAIEDGSFFDNTILLSALNRAKEISRPLHIIGLVSDGGVHSHVNHLQALLKLCRRHQTIPSIHMITDGRDTAPRSAQNYLSSIGHALEASKGHFSTVSGRYYAMDRDNRWPRTEMAWRAMVEAKGRQAPSALDAITFGYQAGEDDEFIVPTVITGGTPIEPGDAVIFLNFRKDRPRQLVSALHKDEFSEFDRGRYTPAHVTCMMEYDQWYGLPYAFEHEKPLSTLSNLLSEYGLKQLHCAETEKYAHVTFFFNGGRGEVATGEDQILIPSPDVATYDLKPEMSAAEVADTVIDALQKNRYAFIVVNFANGDMVGHTAVRQAVIEAVEVLDREVGRLLAAAEESDYSVILTSDHGNCDEMSNPVTGEPHTQHTTYPVPCLIIDEVPWHLACGGGLVNIAPTVLHLMGLPKPEGMKGSSLLLGPVVR
ncbi:MAG: 2,3-bisphosphoglycerate-independent phosphoglycerate mutase [Gammaproteobacteria bacterium]|nr:2,3-bisphosphoglycerate-independent phosphoglycerate mutase [Gammaproteobacteria bacterium]